jgi:hypothetical protein
MKPYCVQRTAANIALFFLSGFCLDYFIVIVNFNWISALKGRFLSQILLGFQKSYYIAASSGFSNLSASE